MVFTDGLADYVPANPLEKKALYRVYTPSYVAQHDDRELKILYQLAENIPDKRLICSVYQKDHIRVDVRSFTDLPMNILFPIDLLKRIENAPRPFTPSKTGLLSIEESAVITLAHEHHISSKDKLEFTYDPYWHQIHHKIHNWILKQDRIGQRKHVHSIVMALTGTKKLPIVPTQPIWLGDIQCASCKRHVLSDSYQTPQAQAFMNPCWRVFRAGPEHMTCCIDTTTHTKNLQVLICPKCMEKDQYKSKLLARQPPPRSDQFKPLPIPSIIMPPGYPRDVFQPCLIDPNIQRKITSDEWILNLLTH